MALTRRTITRGTTYTITVNYKKNGVAASLVGATVYLTAKDVEYDTDADDSGAVISKTVTSHTNAAGGVTTISLSPSDTNVTPGSYHFDIKVKEADGDIYKIHEGIMVIDGSPTNRSVA